MNTASLRHAWRSPQLRNRILAVLGLVVLFRLLSHVPVPVANNVALARFLSQLFSSNGLLGFANLFSGGAMENFSIIMMGVGPYINASIIIQLFTQIVPKLEALQKEGEQGRQKINQYTRLLTVPLAIAQSFGMIFLVRQTSLQLTQTDLIGNPSVFHWVVMVTTITGGTLLLMWIGELISEKGVGNGISLIIFAGIVAGLPTMVSQSLGLAQGDTNRYFTLGIYLLAILAVVFFVVLLNEGTRNIPVSYARRVRGTRVYGGVDTHLPMRVITAGVIPIIFALAFLSVPGFMGQLLQNARTPWLADFARNLTTWFSPTGWIYAASYFVLVVAFTYIYTAIVFNVKDISENLQKQGGFIPGIRPGRETATYLRNVLRRITLAGAVSLGLIAILPFLVQGITRTQALTIGGTGILIVVSVAIETMKQIEAQSLTARYETY